MQERRGESFNFNDKEDILKTIKAVWDRSFEYLSENGKKNEQVTEAHKKINILVCGKILESEVKLEHDDSNPEDIIIRMDDSEQFDYLLNQNKYSNSEETTDNIDNDYIPGWRFKITLKPNAAMISGVVYRDQKGYEEISRELESQEIKSLEKYMV